MTNRVRRLAILTTEEIDELYGPPAWTDADRALYLDVSEAEQSLVQSRTASATLYTRLMLGYFKAKRQFVDPLPPSSHPDVRFLLERHFSARVRDTLSPPSKPARLAIEQRILQAFGFRRCDKSIRDALSTRMQRLARHSTQPRYLLREALDHLERERVVLPAYTTLQDLIGHAVTTERMRLTQQLDAALTPAIRTHLDSLLQTDASVLDLRTLRHEPNDFSLKALKAELDRRRFFEPLHAFAEQFLSTTQVSKESGKYFASLVMYYTVYKLQRMEPATARLYLLCFAYQRFRRINDHLIEAFMAKVDSYEQAAKQASEEAMQRALQEASEHLQAAGQVLQMFVDDRMADDATFAQVKAKAFTYLKPEQFSLVADYMRNIAFDKLGFQWAYYTSLSMTFKRNLRQLFTDLTFEGRVEHAPLMSAVAFLQDHLRQGRSPRQIPPESFPTELIPKRLRRYLYPSVQGKAKTLDIDRYEFLVYRLLCEALEGGNLFVRDSHEFRQFEDDLISDERWRDKEAVLREVDLPLLSASIEATLAQLHADNEAMFAEVNARIAAGDNAHISIRGKGDKRRWTLAYPAAEESLNHPFFAAMPGIGIADLLWYVARETGFLATFTHVLERYVKQAPDPREILACIVALGTNMGLRKMAEVSGLNYASLLNTTRSFLRQETLHATNDAISNATARLSAFPLFHIRDEVHSSSDGQRMETQIDTINARHSPKYFGLHKGVSAYTVVANHIPINGKVIGTHEHESHYVFDLLYNNTSEIKPDRHSTDTHGTNQVNFWVLHTFGYCFAPRYRDLHKKMDSLVGARNPSHYGDVLIRPARKCKDELIINEWPNIQRIMASLAQKDVTQATIIRKLSSYKRQNETKKALWELDNLIRTRYILSYIDDAGLRQSVQKALNRGEAYHRFRRAIAYVNGGKFRVQTEAEQQIWNDCSRLIANAIIHYNTALLSRVYDQKQTAGDEGAIAMLKGVSPAAWQNVNLFGSFEFTPTELLVDLDVMASYLVDWTNRDGSADASEM
ncbi:transposase [Rhodanobacter sp. Root561]|uniref:Tn3 family transposase n=1 Tax=Rhodanobacter sp. Root561 TaxID=1736560 RepID=UPI00070046F5|nr:Tn3 family transposase [Rhodanobacter sp. Root561]KQZ77684.1 transposase [Rhodanobacter sp. Root561]